MAHTQDKNSPSEKGPNTVDRGFPIQIETSAVI